MNTLIYLAGPIDRAEGRVPPHWPRRATAALNEIGLLVYCPHHAFSGDPCAAPEALRSINEHALAQSSALLAGVWPDVPSWGTPMEIAMATQLSKPVVLWHPLGSGGLPAYLKQYPCYTSLSRACKRVAEEVGPHKPSGPELRTTCLDGIDEPKMAGDAGYDMRSRDDVTLDAGEFRRIAMGIPDEALRIAVPTGYWACPMVRSSWAERGLAMMPTVIEQYRGRIYAFAYNLSHSPLRIGTSDRIAQLVLFPLTVFPLQSVVKLPPSDRGENGFGSTGRD